MGHEKETKTKKIKTQNFILTFFIDRFINIA